MLVHDTTRRFQSSRVRVRALTTLRAGRWLLAERTRLHLLAGLRVENAGTNQDGAAFDYVVDLAAGSSYTAHNVRRNALYADDNGQSMLQINLKQGSEVRVHRGG